MFWSRPPASDLPRATPRTLDVVHAGVTHRVIVKRVASARRFTLRVRSADGLAVLTMPPRAAWKTAVAFAERHAAWIGARMGALPERVPLAPGALVPVRGVEHRIVTDPKALRRVRFADGGAAPAILVSGREPDPARAVLRLLMSEARRDLETAVARHLAAAGRTASRLTLRDTRSRWGSCSSRGTLNFSWRLILAPPLVLDYLAAHEVAHLVRMDHSDAFWAVVRRLAPHTDEAEAWLKRHGAGLHRYG